MFLNKYLSHTDSLDVLDILYSSRQYSSTSGLRTLIEKLGRILPFEYAIYGSARISLVGQIESYEVVNFSYPTEWIDLYIRREYHKVDPIFKQNFALFELQYWEDTFLRDTPPQDFMCAATDFDLYAGYTTGIRNNRRTEGGLLSLSGDTIEHSFRTEIIMDIIMPYLHYLASLVADLRRTRSIPALTGRETEVLKWMSSGKSAYEISIILNISERTVVYHIGNIMKKLDAVKRTQAVGIAIHAGLIDPY